MPAALEWDHQTHKHPRCANSRVRDNKGVRSLLYHDDTTSQFAETPTAEAVFWEQVHKSDNCWEWRGKPHATGYGSFRSREIPAYGGVYAHRAAWAIATGSPIPAGLHVLHTCDNRLCVRSDGVGIYVVTGRALLRRGHLFLGTHADNMHDRDAKGRGRGLLALLAYRRAMPSREPRRPSEHRLQPEQIAELRRLWAADSSYGQLSALSRQFGITPTNVRRNVLGLLKRDRS